MRNLRILTLLPLATLLFGLAVEARAEPLKIGIVLAREGRDELDALAINVSTEAFLQSRRFTVLERDALDSVFQEKGLKGFIGESDGTDIGKTLGLDWIGILSYAVNRTYVEREYVYSYLLSVRMLEVASARVIHTIDSREGSSKVSEGLQAVGEHFLDQKLGGNALADTALDQLTSSSDSFEAAGVRLLENILAAFPPQGYVIQRIGDREVLVDLGVEHGLREGDALEVFTIGPPIIHPVTGREIPGREISQAMLKVVSVDAGLSTCKVKRGEGPVDVGAVVRFVAKEGALDRLISKLPFDL